MRLGRDSSPSSSLPERRAFSESLQEGPVDIRSLAALAHRKKEIACQDAKQIAQQTVTYGP